MTMRQRLGKRKVMKYRRQTGLDVIAGMVRGNTGHRVDLCLRDGSIVYLWPDGTMEKCGFSKVRSGTQFVRPQED